VIARAKIENFRALKRVDVELRPLTVLVGPNDSGKSSFLDAINLAPFRKTGRDDWWRGSLAPDVMLVPVGGGLFDGRVDLFKLLAQGIPMVSSSSVDDPTRRAPALHETGANLAGFLDYLLRNDRNRFDQIEAAIRRLVPGLEGIKITAPSADQRAIWLSIDKGFQIPGDRLSTGVRMLFFFVALAHHPDPPAVVLIEEPENGVHPKRLKDIVALLRSISEGKLSGTAAQVILTTHSPYLLDQIHLPDDQVLVFRREENGERTATAVDQERLKAFLDEFMLGEVWYNQGEEGLLTTTR
jgi:predicted ATPase